MLKSKYGNKKCQYGGEMFDSIGERDRWIFLKSHEQAGKVKNLVRQREFKMIVAGKLICTMVPDFCYDVMSEVAAWGERCTLRSVVSDFKGAPPTPDWNIKRKLLLALYDLDVYIVKSPTAPLWPLGVK